MSIKAVFTGINITNMTDKDEVGDLSVVGRCDSRSESP
jgi:hypothetical protein